MPAARSGFVCHYCLGPVNGYPQCWGCHELFHNLHAVAGRFETVPGAITDRFVPMTTALNPSSWYGYLLQYKNGYLDDYGPVLAALAHTYLERHRDRIAALLGGDPTCVTVVPSKRGFAYADQPLVKALSLVPPLKKQLAHTLNHVSSEPLDRRQYNPQAFARGPKPVKGRRVLLLEDSWITGGTPVSAAGALLREGAAAVAIVGLARVLNEGYLSDPAHPYRQAMQAPYDPDAWPR